MSGPVTSRSGISNDAEVAYEQGRRVGLAVAALALSVVAFISLLGLEKAILAAALGVVALRGSTVKTPGRAFGLAAVAIAAVYTVTFVIVLLIFHDKVAELIRLLQQMS